MSYVRVPILETKIYWTILAHIIYPNELRNSTFQVSKTVNVLNEHSTY